MDLILYGVGDIGPCRDDVSSIFQYTRHLFQEKGNLTFGQLESVLSERGETLPHARFTCSGPITVAPALKECGFDVISFGTNHALDWGTTAFCDTLDHLKNAGLAYIGAGRNLAEAREPAILTCNGVTVAYVGYCSILPQGYWADERRGGCNPARGLTVYEQIEHDQPGTPARIHTFPLQEDFERMKEDIARAKEMADIVVASFHWGIHFKPAVIAQYQRIYAHAAIDAGADVIFGHHAHILKPIEVYKGKAIFYSLSNFAMEEIPMYKRDIAAYGMNPMDGKGFKEMQAISSEWTEVIRSFPPDSYKSMIAKCYVTDKKITAVSYLPLTIPLDSSPILLKHSDPEFSEVVQYMEKITEMEHMPQIGTVDGDEVKLTLN